MARYTYAYGYKSADAARMALDDMISGGEVSEAERPRVERYDAWSAARRGPAAIVSRFAITLSDS